MKSNKTVQKLLRERANLRANLTHNRKSRSELIAKIRLSGQFLWAINREFESLLLCETSPTRNKKIKLIRALIGNGLKETEVKKKYYK